MVDIQPTTSEIICDYLKEDLQLQTMLTGADGKIRIYPKDMRAVGWDSTPEVFDQDGLMLAALCVDDTGGTPVLDAPHVLVSDTIYIWAFADRSLQGHREIRALLERCRYVLHGWVGPDGLLQSVFRLGTQDVDDGAFDRMTFTVTGDYLTAQ